MANEISVYRGDTKTINLTFTNSSGSAIDISGWIVFFTVKLRSDNSNDDTNAVIQKDISAHDNAANGETSFTLTTTDTDLQIGSYIYDIQIKDTDDDIYTITVGTFTVNQDITKRTA